MSDLRDKIIVAARELFLEDGIEGVSMRKIADKVGVTAPAIYRHFEDKDELLNEIIIAGLTILEEYLQPALDPTEPYDRLIRLVERYLDFAIEQPRYFECAFLVPSRKIQRFSDEIQQHNYSTFRHAITQISLCMEQGVFRKQDPMETAIMIWATVHGLICLYRMDRFGTEVEQFRAVFKMTVDRMLSALKPVESVPGR